MAEVASMPSSNGYTPHQGYGSIEHGNNAYGSTSASAQSMYNQPPAQEMAGTANQSDIPKAEVSWYFAEQYYTTMSRSPEKLHLFYGKPSQFVSGQETDKVPVSVGQRHISDRIKEMDLHDCKVRVTNVDSQASGANILIVVIGEMSNKGLPHRKFTQTFVLATQTNGYFVLNDILRFLIEEEDEEPEDDVVPPPEENEEDEELPENPHNLPDPLGDFEKAQKAAMASSEDPLSVEPDVEAADKELEEKVVEAQEPPAATVNGDAEPEQKQANHVEETPDTTATDESEQPVENAPSQPAPKEAKEEEKEEVMQPEKPQDPTPSPTPTPAAQAPAQPAAPPKPAAPKTWASLAASANRVATPAAPQQPARQAAAPTKPQAAPAPARAPAPNPATPSVPEEESATPPSTAPTAPASQPAEPSTSTDQQDEWVAVQGHNRQQSRQVEQGNSRGYVGKVHEGIEVSDLQTHFKQFGELAVVEISRLKVSLKSTLERHTT